MTEEDLFENLKRFDALPEDAVVKVTVAAAVLGTCKNSARPSSASQGMGKLEPLWLSCRRHSQDRA
jgi:hypothetical protein